MREVVEWMEQERKRHTGTILGTSFEITLSHYYQHKDITSDKWQAFKKSRGVE